MTASAASRARPGSRRSGSAAATDARRSAAGRRSSPRPSSSPAARRSTASWSSGRARSAPRSRCSRTASWSSTTSPASTPASMVGNVYLGKVQNVLPSMEAAFVDIGRGRNAVLYAGEVNYDASALEGGRRASSRRSRAASRSWCRSPRTRSGTRAPGSPARSACPAATWSTCPTAGCPASAASCPTPSAPG